MDNKSIAIIAIVAVAIIAIAAAAVVLMNNGDDSGDKPVKKATGRLTVYGNANNDDYLDQGDVKTLEEIVNTISKGGEWDYKLYPYADANNDGKITSSDVTYLKKLLGKDALLKSNEKVNMYYMNYNGTTSCVSYPISPDAKIGTNWYYGFYDAMACGCYDRITAGTTRAQGYGQDMFPGCDKLFTIGTAGNFDVELVMKSGVKVLLGSTSQTVYDEMKAVGVDVIMLRGSGVSTSGMDVISNIITMGVLMSCEDAAYEYMTFFDKVLKMIDDKTDQIKREYTYIMPYNPTSTIENMVDTEMRSTGRMLGDTYALSLVPLRDVVYSADATCPTIATEDILKWDPDFIVVDIVASLNACDDPTEVKQKFQNAWDLFSSTNAYKKGNMLGVSYDSIGTTMGIAVIPLLCSYLWPDIFSEEEGWKLMEEAVGKFTNLDTSKIDIKSCGGIIVYKRGA